MVFASISFLFCVFGGAGWGTRASNPLGVSGVITIKMMSKTKRMSMSGTTFIEAIAPFLAPTSIPMFVLLLVCRCASVSAFLCQPTSIAGGPYRGWWRRAARLGPVGEQPHVIHAGRTNLIYEFHDVAVLG